MQPSQNLCASNSIMHTCTCTCGAYGWQARASCTHGTRAISTIVQSSNQYVVHICTDDIVILSSSYALHSPHSHTLHTLTLSTHSHSPTLTLSTPSHSPQPHNFQIKVTQPLQTRTYMYERSHKPTQNYTRCTY